MIRTLVKRLEALEPQRAPVEWKPDAEGLRAIDFSVYGYALEPLPGREPRARWPWWDPPALDEIPISKEDELRDRLARVATRKDMVALALKHGFTITFPDARVRARVAPP